MTESVTIVHATHRTSNSLLAWALPLTGLPAALSAVAWNAEPPAVPLLELAVHTMAVRRLGDTKMVAFETNRLQRRPPAVLPAAMRAFVAAQAWLLNACPPQAACDGPELWNAPVADDL